MARSGSEKRRRSHALSVRFNDQEAQAIRKMADRAGISMGSLLRYAVFNTPPPRAMRSPTVKHKEVARLLGQFGKIGSNLNQLARYANAGRFQKNSIEAALRELTELRAACLLALGRKP